MKGRWISQVETLTAVKYGARGGSLIVDVAVDLGITDRAAKARLKRLADAGLLAERWEGFGIGWTYALTNRGKDWLRDEGEGGDG